MASKQQISELEVAIRRSRALEEAVSVYLVSRAEAEVAWITECLVTKLAVVREELASESP